MALIVQKFGGATVESPAKIAQVALRINDQIKLGDQFVVVVSAMGKTTDNLLALAHELSSQPSLKEIDTLLNTGEMISMSLLTIALKELGVNAAGLCGHQAGIQTDQFFSNASISEIDNRPILKLLKTQSVIVVAGFQGLSSEGELTTLGRGGSDTTALALAASLKADRCEILKDVPAVYSADPRVIETAHPLRALNYEQLLEMTYWGAKVLQYRSVEIAKHFQVPLYVGPAHFYHQGTLITEQEMIEDSEVLGLNSHETVLQVSTPSRSLQEAVAWLKRELEVRSILFPQLLHSEKVNGTIELFVTGPKEVTDAIVSISVLARSKEFVHELSSVTATCRGSTRHETMEKIIGSLESKGVQILNLLVSSMSVTVFVEKTLRLSALQLLHNLIPVPFEKPLALQVPRYRHQN